MGNATPLHPQPSHSGNVLLVDDCETIRNVISRTLEDRGYRPMVAGCGADALATVKEAAPDAIILDINLPDIDGYTVCKRIKCDPTTYRIPVLVLTDLEQPGFEVMAIDAGADDFISKPPDPLVLDARLRMLIQRNRRERLSNPLTGLPGNVLVDQELSCRLAQNRLFCLASVDLHGLQRYNDRYGYQRGDEVILLAAKIVQDAVVDHGYRDDFVGHVGGDDFVLLTAPDTIEQIASRIIGEFDASIPSFYDPRTRRLGHFEAVDRQGNHFDVPIMTVSIAMVSTADREFESSVQMVDAVSELKRYAKSFPESKLVKERRRSPDVLPPAVDGEDAG